MAWTRRDFISTSSLGILAILVPRSFTFGRSAAGEFVELRRNVGIFTARGGTIGWLVNRDGALLVDSQFPDTAQECVAGLRERSAPRLDALINTHHHSDHTGGNGVFREAASRIVAHRRVPELQRAVAQASGSDTQQSYADTTFGVDWMVAVGDEIVRAKHYGNAHTGGDCVVSFERANVVHMGDLVFNRAYPFVDRHGGASVKGWIAALEAVLAEHPDDAIYIFGHAGGQFAVTGDRADVLVQRDFLSATLEVAVRAIADGKSRKEATAVERLPGFPDHLAIADWLTVAAPLGAAYDELSEGG